MNTPRIGLVGVGLMGHGIALNIARKGHALTVLEHPGNQPLDELRALGVASAATVQDLARQVQVLILCVTGSPQVEAVLLGEQGALATLQPGTVVIDCSTAIPASTESVARAVTAAGGRFLDAPMTRTPREAAEGRLNLLVGGDAQLLQECLPLLQCFAENITHTGAVGSGHRMKLLHNYVSLGSVALIAEAAACALAAQVSPQVFVDVLAKGGGGGVALERLRPYLLQQDPSGLRFFMSNALKDMGYYTTMAQDGAAAHGIAQAVHDTFASAVAEGGPQRLVPELVAILGKNTL
ncbi:NAD(P)-dependent oxidoreductase [Alicycliphilus denitrificans]|uniref:2-hydroxy-3-oxopropionate reductase n=2 Tax=Alicycliphilus denitrificans TaxID=179636 RepID=F4GCD4_ALIDK|nr:NAD(P)-dependent oxidoreductase [Alicycliphilus denitrificans]GAO22141.1 2-hydroxy-3-oxopropionate reductase [Alicycliphilus sp. B1]ADU99974.1 6-phosphogluconate dehydrogenase NAD-binding protein [Alicycliphilus denitrificans BC]AEB84793.1 2-hydroxy-3-oxopropionate reductase [Alicycliphilus denitrificans K601]QKD44241.1 NAD(P)-dependent oxidoreductase [Alicycliphilus denitrificans]GAO23387.1 2-hydroxy-3-oxopropionate reductase [Alicycliphilus sp. B1]